MRELVGVWRGVPATDRYGNSIQGPLVLVDTLVAHVAPKHPGEPAEVGREAIVSGYTIYVRADAPTGVLDTDVLEVRGERLPVDGRPQVWRRRNGEHRGEQIEVKGARG